MTLAIIIALINIALGCFVWFRVGRQKAYEELLRHYNSAVDLVARQQQLLEAYRMNAKEEAKE